MTDLPPGLAILRVSMQFAAVRARQSTYHRLHQSPEGVEAGKEHGAKKAIAGHDDASTGIGVPLGPMNAPLPRCDPFHESAGSQLGRGCRRTGLSEARACSVAA